MQSGEFNNESISAHNLMKMLREKGHIILDLLAQRLQTLTTGSNVLMFQIVPNLSKGIKDFMEGSAA